MRRLVAAALLALIATQALAGDEHLFWIKVKVPGAKSPLEAWVNVDDTTGVLNTLHVDSEKGTVEDLLAGKHFEKQKLTVQAQPGFTAEKGGQILVTHPMTKDRLIDLRDEGTEGWAAYLMPENKRVNMITVSLFGVSIR